MFTLDPNIVLCDNTVLLGSVIEPVTKSFHAILDRGPKAGLITSKFDSETVLDKEFDIIFTEHSATSSLDILKLRDSNIRIIFQFPILTANICRDHIFFDRLTGLPKSDLILSRLSDQEFLVKFWKDAWLDHLKSVAVIDDVLLRGIDLYRKTDTEPQIVKSFLQKVKSIFENKRIYLETREFFEEDVSGFLCPSFFLLDNKRRPLRDRLDIQAKLYKARDRRKEIFISDTISDLSMAREFVLRSHRRGFIPVLKNKNEDVFVDFSDKKTKIDIVRHSNRWRAEVDLELGSNRLTFFTDQRKLQSIGLPLSANRFPELLKLPRFVRSFDDTSYDRNMKADDLLIRQLRVIGLDAFNLNGFEVFLLKPDSFFIKQWFHVPELQKIMDRFTLPMRLRSSFSAISVCSDNRCYEIPFSENRLQNMLIVQLYHRNSGIFFAIGQDVALEALQFVFGHAKIYSSFINDESVFVLTSKMNAQRFLPGLDNVFITPLVEKIPYK